MVGALTPLVTWPRSDLVWAAGRWPPGWPMTSSSVPRVDPRHAGYIRLARMPSTPRSWSGRSSVANAVQTTVVDTWGQSWMPRCPGRSSGLIRWPVVDSPELAKPPEKRKVGSSTLPLTTSSEQRRCHCCLVQTGRLTATVTATASAQRRPKLPQSLALLIQRDMRVDRHRDLDGRVADNLPGHVWRSAEVEQERHAGMAEIMKACLRLLRPGSLAITLHPLRAGRCTRPAPRV